MSLSRRPITKAAGAGTGIAALVALSLGVGPLSAQDGSIGTVKTVTGSATVVRGDEEIEARPGLGLLETDFVHTGGNGRLGLSLRDDTRISLGPDTRIHLAQFVFSPADQRMGLTVRLLRGIASLISGRMVKLAPGSVRIETPTSIIGVRGTHVLVRVQ